MARGIPDPILNRMNVYEVQAPDRDAARHIAASCIAAFAPTTTGARASKPNRATEVLDRMSEMAPREMRRAWMTAFGNAKLARRDCVEVEDLPDLAGKKRASVSCSSRHCGGRAPRQRAPISSDACLYHCKTSWWWRFRRARCSTSKRRTASSKPAMTAPTCSCSCSGSNSPRTPGVAFSLVQKLLAFNVAGAPRVEVVILSRNDPVSGMRVFRSAKHYGLTIQRGVFTRGESPWRYLRPLSAHLFLSTNEADVRSALAAGVPAARVFPHSARASTAHPNEVRIAFDGDAVLFSDEAERVFQADGLAAFQAHERTPRRQTARTRTVQAAA